LPLMAQNGTWNGTWNVFIRISFPHEQVLMSDEPEAKLRGKCQGGGCAINKTGQTLVVGIWAGEAAPEIDDFAFHFPIRLYICIHLHRPGISGCRAHPTQCMQPGGRGAGRLPAGSELLVPSELLAVSSSPWC